MVAKESVRNNFQIDLLRHGETTAGKVYLGVTDAPLNGRGWQQMWQAVEGQTHWQRITTSPLKRCREFATQLADRLNLPLTIEPRFQEMNFGHWDGYSAKDILAAEPTDLTRFWTDPLKHSPPEGESLLAVNKRVLNAWQELVLNQQHQLLITHGGPIRLLRCNTEQITLKEIMNLSVAHGQLHSVFIANPIATDKLTQR